MLWRQGTVRRWLKQDSQNDLRVLSSNLSVGAQCEKELVVEGQIFHPLLKTLQIFRNPTVNMQDVRFTLNDYLINRAKVQQNLTYRWIGEKVKLPQRCSASSYNCFRVLDQSQSTLSYVAYQENQEAQTGNRKIRQILTAF